MTERDRPQNERTGTAVQPARWKRLGPRCYVLFLGVPTYFLSYEKLRDFATKYHIVVEKTI